jgi:hypothetical protein
VYPRHVELRDGTLLVTASVRSVTGPGNLPAFPIFESKDGGVTFKWISNLTDQVNGWGMSAQPALYELRKPLGGFKPGTILASGNSWSNNGTRIDLYASTDRARTWQFVSHVAEGGRPNTTNGATPVWEPFLLYVCPLESSPPFLSSFFLSPSSSSSLPHAFLLLSSYLPILPCLSLFPALLHTIFLFFPSSFCQY